MFFLGLPDELGVTFSFGLPRPFAELPKYAFVLLSSSALFSFFGLPSPFVELPDNMCTTFFFKLPSPIVELRLLAHRLYHVIVLLPDVSHLLHDDLKHDAFVNVSCSARVFAQSSLMATISSMALPANPGWAINCMSRHQPLG